jgi:CubicO group peptidase (beta-lactamase class C family)
MRALAATLAATLVACSRAPSPSPVAPPPPSATVAPACSPLVEDDATHPSISPELLQRFREAAERSLTDALVVVKDGHLALRYQRPGTAARFETMSVTKSIAALVFGQLVDAGLVHVDDRLATFFPSWAGDPRGEILVRHVLAQTSGLQDEKTTEAIYASGDFIGFALEAKLEHPPGTRFFYSNKASNLISGIVRKVTGKELSEYARETLFAKLGITDFAWEPDRAGHTPVLAGLQMSAGDLAKIGQLVLDEGTWCGRPVLSRDWIVNATRTLHPLDPGSKQLWSPPYGFLWWLKPRKTTFGFDRGLFDEWARTGMPAEMIDKLRPLEGRFFDKSEFHGAVLQALTGKTRSEAKDTDLEPYYQATWKAGRPDAVVRNEGIASIRADGWLGQYIYVYPDARLVVVRLRHPPADPSQREAGSFKDFEKEIDKLIGVPAPQPH